MVEVIFRNRLSSAAGFSRPNPTCEFARNGALLSHEAQNGPLATESLVDLFEQFLKVRRRNRRYLHTGAALLGNVHGLAPALQRCPQRAALHQIPRLRDSEPTSIVPTRRDIGRARALRNHPYVLLEAGIAAGRPKDR